MSINTILLLILLLIGIGTVLVVSGALYQKISTKRDQRKYPPPGKMVDIGGYQLHIHCTGTGKVTVLLDAGMRSHSLEWALVQPEIAKFTRVCSFDRPGTGWSEKSPLERTSRNIVTELHTALQKANIYGPYIVVGHSFGGLNMHLFAKMYPEEVVGVVLVDSASEYYDRLEKPKFNLRMMELSTRFGLTRFLSNFSGNRKQLEPFPLAIQDQYLALSLTTLFMDTTIEEFLYFDQSAQQLREIGSYLANTPLTVITAGNRAFWDKAGLTEEQCREMYTSFDQFQKELLNKSNYSKQIIAQKSGHMIPRQQPEVIVEAILKQIKGLENRDHFFNETF